MFNKLFRSGRRGYYGSTFGKAVYNTLHRLKVSHIANGIPTFYQKETYDDYVREFLTPEEVTIGNLKQTYHIVVPADKADGSATHCGMWRSADDVYGEEEIEANDLLPNTPIFTPKSRPSYQGGYSGGMAVGSFDHAMDGLPLCGELHKMCTKLKKTHPHIKVRPMFSMEGEHTLWPMLGHRDYGTYGLDGRAMTDVFTLWAISNKKRGYDLKCTADKWVEESKHYECSKRGYANGFHTLAVALHDTKADEYLGILQYAPYVEGRTNGLYIFFSPRISRDKSEYERRGLRLIDCPDAYIESTNPNRLLTSIKPLLTPLSMMEKFWVLDAENEMVLQSHHKLDETANEANNLMYKHQRNISLEDMFTQLVAMHTEDVTLTKENLNSTASRAVQGYLDEKAQAEENVSLQQGLQPLTMFGVAGDERVFFTEWDGRPIDPHDRPNFWWVSNADRIPKVIKRQVAVLDMSLQTADPERSPNNTVIHIPCVGSIPTRPTVEKNYNGAQAHMNEWFTFRYVVYIPDHEIITFFEEDKDGELNVQC